MDKSFIAIWRLFKKFIKKKTPQRAAYLLLLFAFGVGNVSITTSVSAAPSRQGTEITKRFYLNFHPPSVICVGQSLSVGVTTLLEMSGTLSNGQNFDRADLVVPGITIHAKIDSPSIATLDKPQGVTGLLPDPFDLLAPGTFGSSSAQSATVVFNLKGLKPGVANLTVTATIPSGLGAQNSQPKSTVSFSVAYCKYRVVIQSWSTFYAPNLTGAFVQSTIGDMELVDQSGESNTLRGTADSYWYMTGYSIGCSHDIEITDGPPSQLSGVLDPLNHTLKLTVTYTPIHLDSINCGGTDQGDWTAAPITVENLPETGGTNGVSWNPVVGAATFQGQATIRVFPLPSG